MQTIAWYMEHLKGLLNSVSGRRAAALAELTALREQYRQVQEQNRVLQARIAELEARLNRNSRNASLPPSKDPPLVPKAPPKPPTGRQRGGQPGHQGKGRKLVPIGKRLLEEAAEMFHLWHLLREGVQERAQFRREMEPIMQAAGALLAQGEACSHAKTAGQCRNILGLAPALWTFVQVSGVEPANNAAERTVRPGVLWRKGSFGSHSERGSRFAERILTVAATCRQQERNVLDYLVETLAAHHESRPHPFLLPPQGSTLPMAP